MNLKKELLIIILLLLLTGCKGDDIRAFRSIGFSISNTNFKCSYIKGKNIKYLLSNHIILEDGTIYDLSMNLIYQNKNNCKLVDENIKVETIYNEEAFKSNYNRIYNFNHSTDSGYQLDNNNKIADFLLNDKSTLKVINKNDHYYILKNDGNIYDYTITNNNDNYSIANTKILFNQNNYNGKIVDFNYSDNPETIFIKTETTYYRNQIVNEECMKYADVECVYEIKEDRYLNKYKNDILAYNGNTLIMKSGKVLNYSNNNPK